MSTLTSFLDSVGFKSTSKASEWIGTCWECERNLLYFNVDKVVGFCLYCQKTRTLAHIAQELAGVKPRDLKDFIETHESNERRYVGFKDAMEEGLLGRSSLQADKPLVEIPWPEGCRNMQEGRKSVEGKKAIAYLESRGFDIDWVFDLQFGYCATGYFQGRLIIPTMENGALVYYQARDYTGLQPAKKKVLNPSLEFVPNGKSEVLFNYDSAKKHEHIVISESWGSALSLGQNAVGINGQHISHRQYKKLTETSASSFLVILDHGAEAFAWSAADMLSHHKPTWIAFLPHGDPNDVTRAVLNETISKALRYTKAAQITGRLSQHLKTTNLCI